MSGVRHAQEPEFVRWRPGDDDALIERGCVGPAFERLPQPGRVPRSEALERIRGRYITTLRLIDDAEFERGLAAAEAELPAEVEHKVVWLFASAEKPPLDAVRSRG